MKTTMRMFYLAIERNEALVHAKLECIYFLFFKFLMIQNMN